MKKILLFCFLFVQLLAFAQSNPHKCECFVQGIVIDQTSKQPIVGATILLKELNKGSISNEKGYYKIANICEGNYTLTAKIVGYEERNYKIVLEHGTEQNINLSEAELHLANIDIKAQKIDNLTQLKTTLSNKDLEQTRGQSLGETLKQISGVTSIQTGSSISKPVIHGMHSNRVLILNNGIRQEGQQWGSEHAPEIDPFVAKKISVLKGAAGVRYGSDAIAGIIMVEPNALPDSTGLSGEMNTVYFSNGNQVVTAGILEGALAKHTPTIPYSIGYRIQGTFKQGGNISTPTYRLANTGILEKNYSLAANYKKLGFISEIFFSQFSTKIALFSGSHIGNINDLIDAINRQKPLDIYTPNKFSYTIGRPYQDVKHDLLKGKISQQTNIGSISFTLSRQYDFRKEIDILRGDKNLVQLFKLTTYTSEIVFEHKPLAKILTGSVGLSTYYQRNLTNGTLKNPTTSTVLIPNFSNLTAGIFIIERMVHKRWEMEAGVRFDFRNLEVYRIPRGEQSIKTDTQKNQNITGTLGVNYSPNTKLNFQVNISSAWRAPSINELYSNGVHHGAATYEKGDENLTPEIALNNSFTTTYINKSFQVELHLYQNYIRNYIFISPTGRPVLTIRGSFPEFWYTQSNARFQGIDITGNFHLIKNLSLNSKLSFLKAQDLTHQQALIMIPANRWENTLKYEFKKTIFSINNLYVAKQNRVPTRLIFNDIPSSEIIFNNFGGDFAPPPPAYSLWGLSVSQEINLKSRKNIYLSATVNNLFNTSYRDYLNRFRYYADEMGRNIALRLKLEF